MKPAGGGPLPPRSFLGNFGDNVTAGAKAYGRWAAALPSRWARAFAFVGPAIIVVLALSAIGKAIGSSGSPPSPPAVVLLAPSIGPAGAPAAGVTVEPTRSSTPGVEASTTPSPVARGVVTPPPAPPTATAMPPIAVSTQSAASVAVVPLVATQPAISATSAVVSSAAVAPIATTRPATAVPAPPTSTPRPPVVAPTAVAAPAQGGNCSPAYPTVCIPPAPPDLNCKDVPYKRFKVLPPDPHGFDNDHDGIGCES